MAVRLAKSLLGQVWLQLLGFDNFEKELVDRLLGRFPKEFPTARRAISATGFGEARWSGTFAISSTPSPPMYFPMPGIFPSTLGRIL